MLPFPKRHPPKKQADIGEVAYLNLLGWPGFVNVFGFCVFGALRFGAFPLKLTEIALDAQKMLQEEEDGRRKWHKPMI